MPVKNIVIGQKISAEKRERAKELRRDLTPAEKILWHELRANKLGGLHFRRQQVIDGYIVDFYCHACSLVVEVDGGVHITQVEYDTDRDAHLRSRGFNVLRFSNKDVLENLQVVLQKILDTCQSLASPSRFGKGPGDRSGELK